LAQVLCHLPKIKNDNLLIGLDTADDAAVYKLNEDMAIIQTVDFFTPIVDDPYIFGQIAAANSLSDVYAMGGQPLLAMNIVCFPTCLPLDILTEILKGGADKVAEAGALLVGGHTVEDNEPKYGLSVTGTVSPHKVMSNAQAKPGDVLILTKPLGIGVLNTATKANLITDEALKLAIKIMSTLNKTAAEGMSLIGANSCTDITGFGFLGHAYEMAKASNVSFNIFSEQIPFLDKASYYAKMGLVPAGTYSNRKYLDSEIDIEKTIESHVNDLLFDPQTSGGLLISIEADKAKDLIDYYEKNLETTFAVVGKVIEKQEKAIYVY